MRQHLDDGSGFIIPVLSDLQSSLSNCNVCKVIVVVN
jgi:hypothetical protein